MSETRCVIVQTTVESAEQAAELARMLIEARDAACVQWIPVRSAFRWEGEIQSEDEVAMQVKASAAKVESLIARIREHHPYDLPEILVTPVIGGLEDYLAWVEQETK